MRTQLLFLSILSFCLFMSCQSNTENSEELEQNKVVEWVHYKGDKDGKNIVLISGDEEYRSEEVMPQLGKILSKHHGFNCTVLFAQNPEKPGVIAPNYVGNIPGLAALADADLMILQTRFRALPDSQMQYFQDYLLKGKPVIGIRTSTHAFNFKDSTNQWKHWGNYYKGEDEWKGGFGRLVLGERWHTHHGHHKHQSTRGIFAAGADSHPITKGIESGEIWGPSDVYGVRLPLPGDANPIILGQVINRAGEMAKEDTFYGMKDTDSEVATINPAREKAGNPNEPMMPIAWTKSYQIPNGNIGKSFTSTIGSSTDFTNEGVRRLFVNSVHFLFGMEVPEKATVDIVGKFNPSAFAFHTDEYWNEKNMKVSDYRENDN